MSEPVGSGDVVEAVKDMDVRPYGPQVPRGARATVSEVRPTVPANGRCCDVPLGLLLVEYPLAPIAAWCPCGWRRIGPGREEMARRFAEDLNVGPGLPTTIPETVTA